MAGEGYCHGWSWEYRTETVLYCMYTQKAGVYSVAAYLFDGICLCLYVCMIVAEYPRCSNLYCDRHTITYSIYCRTYGL